MCRSYDMVNTRVTSSSPYKVFHYLSVQERYATAIQESENTRRNEILASLSDIQKVDMYNRGIALKRDQDCSHKNICSLPSLYLTGICLFLSEMTGITCPYCVVYIYALIFGTTIHSTSSTV